MIMKLKKMGCQVKKKIFERIRVCLIMKRFIVVHKGKLLFKVLPIIWQLRGMLKIKKIKF